jgi:hypothetical protein
MKDVLIASVLFLGAAVYLLQRNLAYLGAWLLLVTIVLTYGARLKYTPAVIMAIGTVAVVIYLSGSLYRERFEDKNQEESEEAVEEQRKRDARPQSDTTNDPEPHIDMGSTLLSAYKKMKPEQVQQMREDTKELMETQQQLIQTLSMLGPQVQQGAELIKTFQGMFGGSLTDVMKGAAGGQ